MKKWLMITVFILSAFGLTGPVQADTMYTINFDDVATPNGSWGVVPDGYMGFDWNFIEVERIADYQKSFNNKQLSFPSTALAALNGGQTGGNEVVSFSRSQPFVLEGAYFSTWARNNTFTGFSSRGLTITGYRNGEAAGSTTFSLTPEFVRQEFNFGPVDLVEFRHMEKDDAHWWLMDNVAVSPVALPTTLGLFCGGLLALCVFGRRRALYTPQ
jgi:hypothetical protein